MKYDRAFGLALRKRRNELRLSQEALSFKAGAHRTYVSQIERGFKSLSLKVIAQLAEAPDMSMHELVETLGRTASPGEVGRIL